MIGWRWERGLGTGGGSCEGFGELAFWIVWIGCILDSGIVV